MLARVEMLIHACSQGTSLAGCNELDPYSLLGSPYTPVYLATVLNEDGTCA